MRRMSAVLVLLSVASTASAQTSSGVTTSAVPSVVRFTGTLPLSPGDVPVTFGLYREETGGDPLWTETQAVPIEAGGRFAVSLGSGAALPNGLFTAGEARWLDVAVEGLPPQPRRLLVSVPYALKAADSETIGGRPLSAFVLAGDRTGVGADGLTYVDTRVLSSGVAGPPSPLGGFGVAGPPSPLGGSGVAGGAGTPNFIGMFTDATSLGNSVIYQTPAGAIGVNTLAPNAAFHVAAPSAPAAYVDVYSNALGALPVVYRAARGTPAAPAAVQVNDILGGLAVRGYGASTFSAGRGQVMFRAAENWTDEANGTYLQFTTTPIGSGAWTERMRIAPDGKVGIGTGSPAQMLSVAGTIESTAGGFKFPDGTTQTAAASSYSAGAGLSLAGTTFSALFAGSGAAATVARSDHDHSTTYALLSHAHNYLPLAGGTLTGTVKFAAGQTFPPATVTGDWTVSGNLELPATAAAGKAGVLALGGIPFAHGYGVDNTFVGSGAGTFNALASADANVGVGARALAANTSGFRNTAVGAFSLEANVDGTMNSAFGYGALRYTSVSGNSAFGSGALRADTTGYANDAFGSGALTRNTIGSYNSAFGGQCLAYNDRGDGNTCFGRDALLFNVAGSRNSGFGLEALHANDSSDNSAFGYRALYGNTTGIGNSAFGRIALERNTTGASNTAAGTGSLVLLTAGSQNVAVGAHAGLGLADGSNNVFIGAYSDSSLRVGLTNAVVIGAYAEASQSDTMVLGGAVGTGHEVSVGIGTSAPNAKLQVIGNIRVGTSGTNGCVQRFDGTAIAGTCSSDARLKTNVRPFGRVLDQVVRLQPVRYAWRADEFPEYHFGPGISSGLIAQDVEQVFPEMVSTDERGYKMVNYGELPYLTLQALKDLKAENDALKVKVAAQAAALTSLADRLSRLEKR